MRTDRAASAPLVTAAIDFLSSLAQPRRHHIGCGLALADGAIVLAANIVSNFGTASVCAEQIALGQALAKAGPEINLIVTVRATFRTADPYEIVPPCGRCRELLYEYAPDAKVVLISGRGGETKLVDVTALMPYPFVRRDFHMPPN